MVKPELHKRVGQLQTQLKNELNDTTEFKDALADKYLNGDQTSSTRRDIIFEKNGYTFSVDKATSEWGQRRTQILSIRRTRENEELEVFTRTHEVKEDDAMIIFHSGQEKITNNQWALDKAKDILSTPPIT